MAEARRRPIRSEEALKELALNYALRFPGPTERMRKHLTKKMREAVEAGEARPQDVARWVDGVIATLLRIRVLDDAAWAETRAHTLHRRGRALSSIGRDLQARRADQGAVDHALETLREAGEPDLKAAILLARRKRLGPFGPRPEDREARRKLDAKQLATMARAGFSFALAKRVLGAPTPESLEAEES